MRAAVCSGPGRLAVEQVPLPEPGPGEARIRVLACGICGSDLSLLPSGYLAPRLVPGHEMAGRVDALGPGVVGLSVGDAVAVEPLRSCGHCEECRAGRDALCRDSRVLGVHGDGGFAEFACAPARRLFRVPADLAPHLAALTEPLAVVVHALARARFERGQRVLVLGAGTLGLLALVAARDLGAAEVWISARHPHQAELARRLGAGSVLSEAEATAAGLSERCRRRPVDCTLETVGGEADTLGPAVAATRPGGVVAVVGLFRRPLRLDPLACFARETTLAWSNCYEHPPHGADFARAADVLGRRREELAALVTHRVPLEQIARGFDLAARREAGAVKVSILP